MGNGDTLPYNQVIIKLKVRMGKYELEDNFYVLPIGETPHIILGVQWLEEWRGYSKRMISYGDLVFTSLKECVHLP